MAFTFIQGNSAESGTTVTLTGVTAGNLIVIWIKWEDGAGTATVSDGTDSFTMATAGNSGSGPAGQFGYLLSSSSGDKTYTITAPGSFQRFRVAEFSYSGTIVADAENIALGTSSSPASGNIATTGTIELALGGYGEYTANALSGMQINGQAYDNVSGGSYTKMWNKSFSSTFTGQASATLTPSSEWVCSVISFKESGGGLSIPIAMYHYQHHTGSGV